jgi:hypothetical protein
VAGTPKLYSGDAMISPSARRRALLNSAASAGGSSPSMSGLWKGRLPRRQRAARGRRIPGEGSRTGAAGAGFGGRVGSSAKCSLFRMRRSRQDRGAQSTGSGRRVSGRASASADPVAAAAARPAMRPVAQAQAKL